MNGPLGSIYRLQQGIRTMRVSSYDRTGKNSDFITIPAGETAELAVLPGAGIVKHIWITIDAQDSFIRRNAVLRMYWDGEQHPSVESPIGDFFGQGWGEEYSMLSLPFAAAPMKGRALNCYLPMPYGSGAVITLENQSDSDIGKFYYYIDYEQHDNLPSDAGRFHAQWRRELTGPQPEIGENEWDTLGEMQSNKSVKNNYVFADLKGQGHFIGMQYYVDNPGPMWYGEGDDMWLIDGESWPGSLHGTGTEDFFNSSWCPNELYMHPYFGYARIPEQQFGWMGRTHCYRFFLEDPIYFNSSLHGSIEHGHDNSLTLDLCTVAYWYQSEPHQPFDPLPAASERGNMPMIDVRDMHRWRHEWRKAMGSSSRLWGNEQQGE